MEVNILARKTRSRGSSAPAVPIVGCDQTLLIAFQLWLAALCYQPDCMACQYQVAFLNQFKLYDDKAS